MSKFQDALFLGFQKKACMHSLVPCLSNAHPLILLHSVSFIILGFVCLFLSFFVYAQQPPVGYGLIIDEVSRITHNDAPQLVGLLWTNDQLVAQTSTGQHTTLTIDRHRAPGGIRIRNLSRRTVEEPCLRPQGHWDRLL